MSNAEDTDLLADLRAIWPRGPAGDADRGPLDAALGRYRIGKKIGEGGMGVVYDAEQVSPRRAVALKVVRSGSATPEALRRFRHEAEVLARLDHPGIARVYEAGTFELHGDERPFFVMERVFGLPLMDHVRSVRPSRRARLDLFVQICEAVHHAHQRGVIHRDLKPGNILVTDEGRAKVLDFGVARVTDAGIDERTILTDPGQLVGTLPYMSPEQLGGDRDAIDARTDVYALGVLMFELLTGRRPHDLVGASVPDAVARLRNDEPTPLSALDPSLAGDLELIAATALAKEPARRYPSAHHLAEEILRTLADEPILARPPSTVYQLSKFARRHRALVVGGALLLLTLLGGIAATTTMWLRAAAAESDAYAEARKAQAISDFLMKTLVEASPDQRSGESTTIEDVFRRAAERVEHDFPDEPLVRAELHHTIGWTLMRRDARADARPHLESALALFAEHLEGDHVDVAKAMAALGQLALPDAPEEAEDWLRRALEMRTRLGGVRSFMLASNLDFLAVAMFLQGEPEEALGLSRRACELFALDETRRTDHGISLSNHASMLLRSGGDPAEAARELDRAIHILRDGGPPARSALASALGERAPLHFRRGELASAQQALCECARLTRSLGAPIPERILGGMRAVADAAAATPLPSTSLRAPTRRAIEAVLRASLGDGERAEVALREACAAMPLDAPPDRETAAAIAALVTAAVSLGGPERLDELRPLIPSLEAAIEVVASRRGQRHGEVLAAREALANLTEVAGRSDPGE